MVVKYAKIIGRSPAALNMKIGNFGRLDPALKEAGIVGLKNGAKLEEAIWAEFHNDWNKLAYESELLISKFSNKSIEETNHIDLDHLPLGMERESLTKTRVNQNFFRSTILSSYNGKCCITKLAIPEFLIASHIIPWKVNEQERLNPRNGLCLNALHDKAFDRGYLTISSDYKVILSNSFSDFEKDDAVIDFFFGYENKRIDLPEKFLPNPDFLKFHHENIFKL